jgi:cardiolipin synthase
MADSNAAIESMITDIDAARDHVHLTFYLWLPDHNGLKMVEALKRAAARKVICRAMADGLGSRILLASEHWKTMRDAGVHVATALPIGNPLLRRCGDASICATIARSGDRQSDHLLRQSELRGP